MEITYTGHFNFLKLFKKNKSLRSIILKIHLLERVVKHPGVIDN